MRLPSYLLALSLAMSLAAQDPGPGPAAPPPVGGGGGGGATNPTNPAPGGGFGNTNPTNPGRNPFPGQQQDPNNRFPDMMQNRPIFLSGKVVLEDGTPPPDQVVIERVCNGTPRPEGYTDSKGRFSFELGRNNAVMADASTSSGLDDGAFGGRPGFGGGNQRAGGGFGGLSGGRGINERDLMGCEIRAQLPGFRSEVVNLAGRRSLDNPDVGTIILRRLANVEGFTFSLTTAMAPKEAKKSYEKGLDLVKKKKLPEATAELEKATSAYPKYAVAWQDLGKLYETQRNTEGAIKAFEAAIAADPKYVNPYVNLSRLYGAKKEWQKTAEYSAKGIRLNPFEFLQLYYVNAVANMNLGKFDDAEKAARDALKLDSKGQVPRLDHLLGVILVEKQDFGGAKASLESYLRKSPNAPDAAQIREQLTQLASAKPAAQAVRVEPAPQPTVSAPVAPPPVAVTPRAAWPSWGGGISDLPPATLSKTLDSAALNRELNAAVYWIYTSGAVSGLNKPDPKYQGAAVAVSKNLLVTNCDVLEGTGATGLYQGGKLITSNVRLSKSKRAAGMCVLEAVGATLTPVNGVRNAQDLSAGEKTFTLTAQGLGEGKLTSAKVQGGLRLLHSTSPVNGANNGGGLFDEFGNLIGVTTTRSQNASISAEEFYQ